MLRFHISLIGRVEGWRAHGRVRWQFHGFRRGPQSGSPGHVSSPRHVERSRRISRTPLSCPLRATAYATYRSGSAFGGGTRPPPTPPGPPGAAFPLAYIPRLRSCRSMGAFIMAPLPPVLPEEFRTAGPLRSTGVTRFGATTGPSATLSPSADFPGSPVIRPTQLPPFRVGTRRASPVARCALVAVLSLTTPPE
jgi:hypothetical protein